jgi:hypothetical protein
VIDMWRWFGFGDDGESSAQGYGAGYGIEVLESGWIPPQPQPQASVSEAHPPGKIDGLSDIAAFLARVYANQVC